MGFQDAKLHEWQLLAGEERSHGRGVRMMTSKQPKTVSAN